MKEKVLSEAKEYLESSNTKSIFKKLPLEDLVKIKLETFIEDIKEVDVVDLYEVVIQRVERPLLSLVLQKTKGNQIKAASILGINRNTLRKKMTTLKIDKGCH